MDRTINPLTGSLTHQQKFFVIYGNYNLIFLGKILKFLFDVTSMLRKWCDAKLPSVKSILKISKSAKIELT